jgi:uncharacterized protein YbjT (DUF2867 family)
MNKYGQRESIMGCFMPKPTTHVLLAGASGLVGQALLAQMLLDASVASIITPVRKPLSVKHTKLHEVDWQLTGLTALDECYLCLGTTMKVAGSPAAFKSIDHDLVLMVAQAALTAGAKRVALVSSVGADAHSKSFYLRTKGETEAALTRLVAQHGAQLVVLRPSLLAGKRNECRMCERLGLAVAALLRPVIPARYRPVQAAAVAAAMVTQLRANHSSVCTVIESQAIHVKRLT